MRRIGATVAMAATMWLMLAGGHAGATVKDAAANGFTVENEQTVPVAPDAAWKALVEDIDRWWPKDHTWWGQASRLSLQPHAGGCFCEIGKDGKQQALHMTVSFVDPGKTLRLLGGLGPLQGMGLHGALEFKLAATADGGTRIVMSYRAGGYTPDDLSKFVAVVDQVQGLQLQGLGDYLRRAPANPAAIRPAATPSSATEAGRAAVQPDPQR